MMQNIFQSEDFSLQKINTLEEVKAFARYLVEGLKLNFHPDDDFSCYEVAGMNRSLTTQEVETGNRLMDECFAVCEKSGVDVYEVMGQFLTNHVTGKKIA
jgi:hypothetical protein